jgi:hypothetical protein
LVSYDATEGLDQENSRTTGEIRDTGRAFQDLRCKAPSENKLYQGTGV